MVNQDVAARAAKIRMLLMDVDGVLTDGKLYFIPDGAGGMVEFKAFDSQDGIGLQWCQWKGIRTGVISGRNSPSTVERAKQAKMNYVYQGHTEKIPIIEEIMADAQIAKDEIAYIGDDFTDVVVFHRVGLAIATANARPEVKREAHWVTQNVGGSGAVRDAIEMIFRARGFWNDILDHYEVGTEKVVAEIHQEPVLAVDK
jgi:3-deoxy-D-manno-octulosonate 8-phosphate phosphatase (KDO 8-P phosphatase)